MIPIEQTKLHDPPNQKGNCMAACLASLLELHIDEVPKFEDMGEEWWPEYNKWLESQGFYLIQWTGEAHKSWRIKGFYLVAGKSPRGDFQHLVIYKNGELVHDPHPDKTGVVLIERIEVIVPFDPAKPYMPHVSGPVSKAMERFWTRCNQMAARDQITQ